MTKLIYNFLFLSGKMKNSLYFFEEIGNRRADALQILIICIQISVIFTTDYKLPIMNQLLRLKELACTILIINKQLVCFTHRSKMLINHSKLQDYVSIIEDEIEKDHIF